MSPWQIMSHRAHFCLFFLSVLLEFLQVSVYRVANYFLSWGILGARGAKFVHVYEVGVPEFGCYRCCGLIGTFLLVAGNFPSDMLKSKWFMLLLQFLILGR